VIERLLEELRANRRIVIRPHVSHPSAATVLVDLYHVVDVREVTARAFVLAGATGISVQLDELHVVGLHGEEDKRVGLATVDFSTLFATMRIEEGRAGRPASSGERNAAGRRPAPCISSVVGPYPFRGVLVA